MNTEQGSIPLTNNRVSNPPDKIIEHPAFGTLERRQASIGAMGSKDALTEVYQDDANRIYLFFGGLLRAVINPNFWREAEISVLEGEGYVQVQSAGQPVMNFPESAEIDIGTWVAGLVR